MIPLQKLLNILEECAPAHLAEDWDNPGLLISPEKPEIQTILVALDATPAVAQEAADRGADLVLTHHPLFFNGVKHILHDAPDTAAAWRLVRHGIGLYAAHTNLDAAKGGVNDALAGALVLTDVQPLSLAPDHTEFTARIGKLPAPMALSAFAAYVGKKLDTCAIYAGDGDMTVQTIALVGGSGGEYLQSARAAGAEVLVTGEAKHYAGITADVLGMGLIVAGHHETECVVLAPWIEALHKRLEAVQCKVDFVLSKAGTPPFSPA